MSTLKQHMTSVVFALALMLSGASLVLDPVFNPVFPVFTAVSLFFNLWSLYRSDRGGFVKAKEMRRAYEPRRQFSGLQTFVLLLLVMSQVGTGTYVLVA